MICRLSRFAGPTLYGILPYAGLKFYIYEMMKLALVRATDEQPSLPTKLGCGGVAGIIGQTLTYPLDVVRRQMQVSLKKRKSRGLSFTFVSTEVRRVTRMIDIDVCIGRRQAATACKATGN